MPILITVGQTAKDAKDQAKFMIGPEKQVTDSTVIATDFLQFNKSPLVAAPINGFSANTANGNLFVCIVNYDL